MNNTNNVQAVDDDVGKMGTWFMDILIRLYEDQTGMKWEYQPQETEDKTA